MMKAYWPALLWLVIITILSVMPNVQLPSFNLFSMDKLAHAGVYGIFTWLLLHGYLKFKGTPGNKTLVAIACISIFYGVLMEFVQFAFIPGRFYEIDDMLANSFGSILGLTLFRAFFYKMYIHSNKHE
ncbi:MAG: VanZ family protein [Saprospiraceae bacterium]|nr:VanZ family protein [Saprospiraceae bacterium]